MEAQFGTLTLKEELEKVQNRAARFVTGNYVFETGSMTHILGQLKWESLKKRRKDSRLILLYKCLKGKARIPTDDLIPKNSRCRNQHFFAFQIPSASKEAYKSSFFPPIRDWNDLSDSLISSVVTKTRNGTWNGTWNGIRNGTEYRMERNRDGTDYGMEQIWNGTEIIKLIRMNGEQTRNKFNLIIC